MNNTRTALGIKDVISFFVGVIFEAIRGPCNLVEIKSDIDAIESLIGFCHHGYRVQIHCKEIKYQCKYKRWYIPNRIRSIYSVYADVSDNAPESLKTFCKEEKHFPKLLMSWMPSSNQREAAIRGYLDILIAKTKKIK